MRLPARAILKTVLGVLCSKDEEHTPAEDLPGYRAYMEKVKYR